jgi:purine-binding chemotaxis protein CheW
MSDNDDILNLVRQRYQYQANSAANRNEAKVRLLVFRLGNEWYALEAQEVREISRLADITRVPLTPSHIMGVVNLRGAITAVIDIRAALGLPQAPLEHTARIIVACHENLEAGIVAEAVVEMVETLRSVLQPPLLTIDAERGRYASAVLEQKDNRLIIVLNLASLLEGLKL